MIQKYFPSKRNPSIEFYRIIGSLIVIGVHSKDLIPKKKIMKEQEILYHAFLQMEFQYFGLF
jgi:hypothetical protein